MSGPRAAESASHTDAPVTDLDLAESITAAGRTETLVVAVLTVGTELSVPAATIDQLYSAGTDALALRNGLNAVRATTDVGALTRIPAPPDVDADMVLAVGLGTSDGATDPEILRRAAGSAARSLAGIRHAAFALPAETPELSAAVALGAELGAYAFARYRTTDKPKDRPVRHITVLSRAAGDPGVVTAFTRSRHLAVGITFARDLVNTAPCDQTPADLADVAVHAGSRNGLEVEVLDEGALARGGYGALLGVCRALTNAAGCRTVAIGYRLAPEHRFPAAVEDCYAAVRWLADHGDELGTDTSRLAVAGDSAGGNLAAVTALLARDRGGPPLSGQVLLYPNTDQTFDLPGVPDGHDLPFNERSVRWYRDNYLPDKDDGANPLASPLRAPDLSGLPPALVITAEYDPLRAEGIRYATRLQDAGVDVEHVDYPGMIHGFLTMLGELDASRQAVSQIAAYLRTRLDLRSSGEAADHRSARGALTRGNSM